MTFNDKKTLVSEYNEAYYQIGRLNVLWSTCNSLSRQGKLIEWKWVLDRIWVELSADAHTKDEKKYFGLNKKHNDTIAKAKQRPDLYNALQDKEIFLRLLQNDVGKGSKWKEEYEDIM